MPRLMLPRLRFLLIALLAGGCGAALELADVATARPWRSEAFTRTAVELAALWSAATLGIALAALIAAAFLRREVPPAAGLLAAPVAWGLARLVLELDGRGSLVALGLVGALTLGAALLLMLRVGRALAPVRLLASPIPLVVVLAAASAFAVWRWRETTPRAPAPPAAGGTSVLWISLDTLRADRLGCYGGPATNSPNLDALAREGVLFGDATCPMPLTAPSHVAMLTGLMPHESGVRKNGMPLPDGTRTLPRLLGEEGWLTAAFVSGFPLFERSSRLAGHFHHYDDQFDHDEPLSEGARLTPFGRLALRARRGADRWHEPIERAGDQTVDRTLAWLDAAIEPARPRPFFVFCHLYDVHAEYLPHEGQRRSRFWDAESSLERLALLADEDERRLLAELYDGEVRFVDRQVGRLIERLRERGLLDRTLVLVTSDHGESLGEHDYWYEHINPYHVETHVPLILRLPNAEHGGSRVEGAVQLTDLAVTVRDLLEQTFELPGQGSTLAPTIGRSGRLPDRRIVLCQSMFDFTNAWFATSARNGRFKLLRRSPSFQRYDSKRTSGSEQLFDLVEDPGELVDLLAGDAVPAEAPLEELRAQLDEFERVCLEAGPDRIDEGVRAMLEKLGYAH